MKHVSEILPQRPWRPATVDPHQWPADADAGFDRGISVRQHPTAFTLLADQRSSTDEIPQDSVGEQLLPVPEGSGTGPQ